MPAIQQHEHNSALQKLCGARGAIWIADLPALSKAPSRMSQFFNLTALGLALLLGYLGFALWG